MHIYAKKTQIQQHPKSSSAGSASTDDNRVLRVENGRFASQERSNALGNTGAEQAMRLNQCWATKEIPVEHD